MSDYEFPAPGLYPDMAEEEYFSLLAFSNSGAKDLLRSMAHYHHARTKGFKQTDAMLVGKMVHTLVLEPELYAARYLIVPDCRRGTKQWEGYVAEAGSREVIKQPMADEVDAIANAVARHPAAKLILQNFESEQSLIFEQHGVPCKARIDIPQEGYLADLKKVADASPSGFSKAVGNFGYHRQSAHYESAFNIVTGVEPEGMLFVCVESEAPYAVGIYEVDREDVNQGAAELAEAAKVFKRYIDGGAGDNPEIHHGYGKMVQAVSLPRWAKRQEEMIHG